MSGPTGAGPPSDDRPSGLGEPGRGERPRPSSNLPGRGDRPRPPSDLPGRGDRPGPSSNLPGHGDRPRPPSDLPGRGDRPGPPSDLPGRGDRPGPSSNLPGHGDRPRPPSDLPGRGDRPGPPSDLPGREDRPGPPSDLPGREDCPRPPSDLPGRGDRPRPPSDLPGRGDRPRPPSGAPPTYEEAANHLTLEYGGYFVPYEARAAATPMRAPSISSHLSLQPLGWENRTVTTSPRGRANRRVGDLGAVEANPARVESGVELPREGGTDPAASDQLGDKCMKLLLPPMHICVATTCLVFNCVLPGLGK